MFFIDPDDVCSGGYVVVEVFMPNGSSEGEEYDVVFL